MTKSNDEKNMIETVGGEKITWGAFLAIAIVVGLVFLGLMGIVYVMTISPDNPTSSINLKAITKGMG